MSMKERKAFLSFFPLSFIQRSSFSVIHDSLFQDKLKQMYSTLCALNGRLLSWLKKQRDNNIQMMKQHIPILYHCRPYLTFHVKKPPNPTILQLNLDNKILSKLNQIFEILIAFTSHQQCFLKILSVLYSFRLFSTKYLILCPHYTLNLYSQNVYKIHW